MENKARTEWKMAEKDDEKKEDNLWNKIYLIIY